MMMGLPRAAIFLLLHEMAALLGYKPLLDDFFRWRARIDAYFLKFC